MDCKNLYSGLTEKLENEILITAYPIIDIQQNIFNQHLFRAEPVSNFITPAMQTVSSVPV